MKILEALPQSPAQPSESKPTNKFESPVKKRPLHQHLPGSTSLVRDHLTRPIKKLRFTIATNAPDPLDLEKVPDPLKYIVGAIEEYIKSQNLENLVAVEIHSRLNYILNCDSFTTEQKEMELGILLFYVTARKSVPKEHSLLEARMDEIEAEVLLLRYEHKSACPDSKEIPSGSIHYIHRALVHMIFTENGEFNYAGCLAVKTLMESRLCVFFPEESQAQILKIVSLLMENKEFLNQFMQPITVHPTLNKLIKLDLKKAISDPISPIWVRYALLMQLFSLIGQFDEGHCYANAVYSNLLTEHPVLLLKMTIELLQTGKLRIDGVEIPVDLLVENCLFWEKDLSPKMTHQSAYALTPVLVAKEALGISNFPPTRSPHALKLDNWMTYAFGSSATVAKQFFAALKHNMLQKMVLSVLQFIAKNSSVHSQGIETAKSEWIKEVSEDYVRVLHELFEKAGIKSDPDIEKLLARLQHQLHKKLFTVDMRNWKRYSHNKRIFYDNHPVGFLEEYAPSRGPEFDFLSRLYFLEGDSLRPVDRLSEFGECLAQCVAEVTSDTEPENVIKAANLLKQLFKSEEYRKIVAKWLESINREEENSLGWKAYFKSDAFFLSAAGSSPLIVTDFGPLRETYTPYVSFSSTSVEDFFKNLCAKIREAVTSSSKYTEGLETQILIRHKGHVFNLSLAPFSLYWKSEEDLLATQVLAPAQHLLAAPISIQLRERILVQLGGMNAKTVFAHHLTQPMTAKEFKSAILLEINPNKIDKFKEALNDVLQKIPFETLKSNVDSIVQRIGRSLNQSELHHISAYFAAKCKRKYLTAYHAAKLLKNALFTLENPLKCRLYQLEQAIREEYRLPQVIQIANLNYSRPAEKLKFVPLIVHYHLADEQMVLSRRDNGFENPYPSAGKLISETCLIINQEKP